MDTAADRPASLTSLSLRGVTPNRLAVPPMCQYWVSDGFVGDHHLAHRPLRLGGSGLVVVEEGTGVTPAGRISPGDVGLWDDARVPGLARVGAFLRAHGSVPAFQARGPVPTRCR